MKKSIRRRFRGENTENAILGEGKVYFDALTSAIVPDDKETKILINLEVQNDGKLGYHVVVRGIYYGSRLISKQLGTEFTVRAGDYKKYGGLKRSIRFGS